MSERLIGRKELHQRMAPQKTPASFNNSLTKLYARGFPRPRKVGDRSVAWVESEVDAFVLALERSDGSASPNKKARKKLTRAELDAKLREICRIKPVGEGLEFLRPKR